jgi:hypothetical protein
MSQEHQVLLDELRFAIAAELAVLHELAEDLGEIGFDEEAARVDACARDLEKEGHPMDLASDAVPKLKAIVARLWESKHPHLVKISRRLQKTCKSISTRAVKVMTETQPIDEADKPSNNGKPT